MRRRLALKIVRRPDRYPLGKYLAALARLGVRIWRWKVGIDTKAWRL